MITCVYEMKYSYLLFKAWGYTVYTLFVLELSLISLHLNFSDSQNWSMKSTSRQIRVDDVMAMFWSPIGADG